MTRWNDYLALGNAFHHHKKRKPLRFSKILATILASIILATIFASVAAEYTAGGLQ